MAVSSRSYLSPVSAINAAVIGCGRIAWMLETDPLRYKPCTHLGALVRWQKKRALQVTALCDSDFIRAKDAAHFFHLKNSFLTNNYKEIILQKPNLLVIAASTAAHSTILSAALDARIERIVVEKPVAFSAKEARLLRKKITKSKSIVLANYERRYHPKYIALQKETEDAISYRGVFAASGHMLYPHKKSGDEGVLLHDTTHLLDLAQFYFGRVCRYKKIAEKNRHVLYLEHASGVHGVIETALNVGVFHLELELHTKQKRIRVGNGFLTMQEIQTSPHYKNFKSYAKDIYKEDKPFSVAQNPFIKLYETLLEGRATNDSIFDALQNVEILGEMI
ncbi:MAG TPA: Gfo/Idh/MocA family oxidoreductase [Turneriella sp.]|nr:Gfo/Idh/MocA family oxidoreductase [Turneriella sp.]